MFPHIPRRALVAVAVAATLVSCVGYGVAKHEETPGPTGDAAGAAVKPRPSEVPLNAIRVGEGWGTGDLRPDADPADRRIFYAMRCENDLLTIATTVEAIYARLPCAQSIPDDVSREFLSERVRISLVGAEKKMYVDTATAGSFELSVGDVWVVTPK